MCSAGKISTQQFTLAASGPKKGNLFLNSNPKSCVALAGGGHENGGLTMFTCKQGKEGMNEEFTLAGGQLCSHSLANEEQLCLKPMNATPSNSGGHHGSGGGGFNCIADAAALARCQVHFTMWTIMKAPLLLGNDLGGAIQWTVWQRNYLLRVNYT